MTTLTIIVVVVMAALILLNMTTIFSHPLHEKYLAYNDVNGIDVEQNGLLWTMNFDQQNKSIEYINRSLSVERSRNADKAELNFTRLIIHRFKEPDIILEPVTYEDNNLIFNVPEWNKNGFLLDTSRGQFKTLISQTYDH